MDDCLPALDALFGPAVAPCRRAFDFTLLFEESILTIAPAALFIILSFQRLYILLKRQPLIQPRGYLHIGKLLTALIYTALQIVFLALTCMHPHTRTSIPAATLTLLTALLIPALSHLEHTRSIRPSTPLCVYLLLTLPFDGARARTLWLSFSSSSSSPLTITTPTILIASLGVKLFLLILECVSKHIPDSTKISPQSTAGILSQTFLLWLLPLLRAGYKGTLQLADLYPIPPSLLSSSLCIRFRTHWTPESPFKHALLLSTANSLPRPLLAPVIPRLALIGFTFAQPFLVSRVLSYLAEDGEDENRKATGYSLMAAYGIVYTGIAASNTFYSHLTYCLMTAVRGGLISMIYEHTLTLPSILAGASTGPIKEKKQEMTISSAASSSSSEGEQKEKNTPSSSSLPSSAPDAGSAVTLMSTDVERIVSGLKYFHEPWANTIECILAVYLLSRQVGVSGLAMVALALLCVIATTRVAGVAGVRQGVWMAAIQNRVRATAGVLGAIKGVKMMGLESRVGGVLQRLREVEVEGAGLFRRSIVWSIGLSYATLIFSPLLVFAAFTGIAQRNGQTLDVERMFTSLTLISLLAAPLVHLFQALPALSAVGSCAGRIQAFLKVQGRVEVREVDEECRVQSHTPDPEERGDKLEKKVVGVEMIVVRGGSFGFSPDGPPVVKDVNLRVECAELVMLLGPVGCGKSTLLKGLLGEVAVLAGTVSVSGGVAYCDQTAWLVNDSVRANVIGPAELNEEWYRSVMRACVLDEDIERLAEGDETGVGSKGVGLSGGQQQRLALARALYARREILILDDIFSGLDRTTVELLFERLWGTNGLLRRLRTTVVFATHNVGYLQYADRVIALGADGSIVEQGTTAEILAADGYIKSLYSARQSVSIVDDDPAEERAEAPSEKPMEEGKVEVRTRDRDVYRYYFKAIGKLNTVAFVFGGICFAVLLKFPDQWLTWWSNANTAHPNQSTSYYLGVYAVFNILAFVSLCAWAWHLFHGVVATSGKNLHRELLNTVMSAPFPYISRIDTGVTTNRFSQDMLLIDGTLPLSLFNTAAELFTFIVQIGLIAAASAFILAAFPFIFAVVYVIQRFYLYTSKQLRLMDIEAKAPLYAHFIETSSGLTLIRAYGWQRYFTETTFRILDESQKPFYLLYCVQVWLNLVLDLVVAGLAMVIIGIAVGRQGLLSASAVGLALVNITTLGETLKNLVVSYTSLETSMGAITRLETFTRETPNENAGEEINQEPLNWPGSGVVELKDISAAYREEGTPVLKNISLKIEAGQKIAVCGRSGSGKTSLLTAFCRMLDLTSGTIYIDGIDLSTIHRNYVRSRLNVVPQDAYAFPGSVRANLDLAGSTPDEELIRILTRVELWEKIKELGGLDAEMNLEGLSAGQKQLVCLARAMVKRDGGRILLLDEATSSVDAATEKLMQRIIEEEFKDHTVIAVLHRLGSALEYEKIAVLDKGVLVDFDTPEKLVESNPLFKGFTRQS